MSFTTPDLSDAHPETKAIAPILKNFGGREIFWGEIETLRCPDDNSFVKELLNNEGNGKVLVVHYSCFILSLHFYKCHFWSIQQN